MNKLMLLIALQIFVIFTSCSNNDDLYDGSVFSIEFKSRIIAHRGVWNVAGSCENSRTSISLASTLDIWGAEFDIHQTKDGYWILNHDAKYNGYSIKDYDYATLSKYPLTNGESLPTLIEIMEENVNSETSLMIEVKSGDVKSLLKTLEPYKDIKKCFISFSNEICEELIAHDVKPVYLLLDDVKTFDIDYYTRNKYDGVSVYYPSLFSNPKWIKKFHDAGMTVTVWTVDSQTLIKEAFEMGVDYVVTNCAETLFFE